MVADIHIYEIKRMDLKGGIVIDGFPSVGLVSSIVANYIINVLDLEQIGVMDSIYFPTVSLIRNSEPQNPVRIYGGEAKERKIIVFISEFQPPPNLIKPVAATLLDWAIEQKCSMVISPEGMVVERFGEEGSQPPSPSVYGIATTEQGRSLIEANGVKNFSEGVITGVAGVLLNEGKRREYNVVCLLAEAHPEYPDARAAARIIEVLDSMILKMHIDTKPLYEEAEKLERQIKAIHAQAEQAKKHKIPPTPQMYG
ncbi:MAG: proteasome assembly chaperone family protein [Thermoplasmata archaeon]|nr:MAG: proteasome assembly chaperone family protein [Thermoplasmata archaeon]